MLRPGLVVCRPIRGRGRPPLRLACACPLRLHAPPPPARLPDGRCLPPRAWVTSTPRGAVRIHPADGAAVGARDGAIGLHDAPGPKDGAVECRGHAGQAAGREAGREVLDLAVGPHPANDLAVWAEDGAIGLHQPQLRAAQWGKVESSQGLVERFRAHLVNLLGCCLGAIHGAFHRATDLLRAALDGAHGILDETLGTLHRAIDETLGAHHRTIHGTANGFPNALKRNFDAVPDRTCI
eukprot:scaffold5640_cov52-Phaeocystis_antarctica.AAC.3